jgi:hypothetical protein
MAKIPGEMNYYIMPNNAAGDYTGAPTAGMLVRSMQYFNPGAMQQFWIIENLWHCTTASGTGSPPNLALNINGASTASGTLGRTTMSF